jgi:hypothetical protein
MALRIKDASLPKSRHICSAILNGFAAFQEQYGNPVEDKGQGGEEARRTATDDNRPPPMPIGHGINGSRGSSGAGLTEIPAGCP